MGDTKSTSTTEKYGIFYLCPRTYELRILPHHNSPGGLALYEFQDGLPLDETTYPTPRGRAYYQAGDLIMPTALPTTLFLKRFPNLQKTFPVNDPMAMLANSFGATQAFGFVIVDLEPAGRNGYGWIELQEVLIFGTKLAPTEHGKSTNVRWLQEEFSLSRGARRKRIVPIIAEIITDLSIALLTAGAGSATKALRKQALARLRRKFMGRASKIFFVAWMRKELIKNGLSASLAFVEAFVQTYATADFQDRVRNGVSSAKIKPKPTAMNRALVAGITAFLQALLGVAESKMLNRFRKNRPKHYRVQDNPASFRAWMATYLTEHFIKTFSTGAVSKLLNIIGQALDRWIQDDAKQNFAKYLASEIQNELDHFIQGEVLAALRGMIELGGEVMAIDE